MSPREVIARALCRFRVFDSADVDSCWMDYLDDAGAVIAALGAMEITEAMQDAVVKWEEGDEHIAVLWRAMVGAMRDE